MVVDYDFMAELAKNYKINKFVKIFYIFSIKKTI